EAVEPVEVLGRVRPHEPGHPPLAVAHHRRHAAAPRRALAREAEAVAVQDGGPDQARARAPAAPGGPATGDGARAPPPPTRPARGRPRGEPGLTPAPPGRRPCRAARPSRRRSPRGAPSGGGAPS